MKINVAEWTMILTDGSNLPDGYEQYDTYNSNNDWIFPKSKPGYFVRKMWMAGEATHFRPHQKSS